MRIPQVLQKAGFSEKQADIFLALLKYNDLSPTELSEKTRVDRTLCYSILNQLIKKGYVKTVIGESTKRFQAVNPEWILEDIEQTREHLKSVLPELKKMARSSEEETKVELLKGKKGVERIFWDVLDEGVKEYYLFGHIANNQFYFPIQLAKFLKQLEKRNIVEKLIYPEEEDIVLCKTSKVRYVPKHLVSPTTTYIYGNKVAIIIWAQPFVMVRITSKEMAATYKSYFDLLWKNAELRK
jgi:sugar-specific transcriptional regulator TrmB